MIINFYDCAINTQAEAALHTQNNVHETSYYPLAPMPKQADEVCFLLDLRADGLFQQQISIQNIARILALSLKKLISPKIYLVISDMIISHPLLSFSGALKAELQKLDLAVTIYSAFDLNYAITYLLPPNEICSQWQWFGIDITDYDQLALPADLSLAYLQALSCKQLIWQGDNLCQCLQAQETTV